MKMMNPHLVVELVVDNVVQLIVVLLDVDVEPTVLNCYDVVAPWRCPLRMLHPLNSKELVESCRWCKDFLVEHEVNVVDHCCAIRGVDLQETVVLMMDHVMLEVVLSLVIG